jgi:hypothetical protein
MGLGLQTAQRSHHPRQANALEKRKQFELQTGGFVRLACWSRTALRTLSGDASNK